ncbi:alkene reductase [Aeromonas sanarellii]|uniref:Alkene reductase n=1 Tax=Aeromonas sanarellii TaxID=633415 RepID=A0ABS4B949_9GAMM|nr:alkene reductase [Aeromonas sanarellii]MBP0604031.1 alkene reductase [Aeromonas sanarellii]
MDTLFQPYRLNDTLTLANRFMMAPLTRCMAGPGLVPTEQMAAYYGRRADIGLIISEATIIRPDGQGYPNTPGLYSAEQVEGWKKVTAAVHARGGKIFAQLWHVGRLSHPFFHHAEVLAPSAVAHEGTVPRMRELVYQVPRALTESEIAQLVEDYAQAAANAIEAGFDGVEIHGANGYLIDQFLHHASNLRTDNYGGSPENMSRFALEVVDAINARIGGDRTGLRLSPGAYVHLEGDARDRAVFDHLLAELNQRTLAYVHLGIFDDSLTFDYLDGRASDYLRAHYDGHLVGVGNYSAETAAEAIEADRFDLVAIGRPLIANPDYLAKVKQGEALTPYADTMLAELV